jgi:hypothetical protein
MVNFTELHQRAHAAGEAAPNDERGFVRIALAPNTNFTRWAKKQGLRNIRPKGYARAYVKVLQEHGELARVEWDEVAA